VLQVEGITKRFGGLVAVNAVSFGLDAGEVLSVVGPNGAGKTTLFNLITGVLRPDGGRVVLDTGRTSRAQSRIAWRDWVSRAPSRTFGCSAT